MLPVHRSPTFLAGLALATGLALTQQTFAADAPKADLVASNQLRVCTDPSDLPFSNEKSEGFENKVADIISDELKLPVAYTYFPKAMGFTRMTLFAKKCDLIIGWGQGDDLVLNSNHFYRSTSVLIYKAGTGLDGVDTLSDPRLKDKKVGEIAKAPSSDHVAKNGLMTKAKHYRLMVDRRFESPHEEMMKDIRSGEIDAAVGWGPAAGYFATRGGDKLVVVPLLKEKGSPRLDYRITMGVRQGDDAFKRKINEVIAKRQGDIDKVMLEYGVPLLVDDDTSMEQIKEPRKNGAVYGGAADNKAAAAPAPAPAPAAPKAAGPAPAATP